MIKLIEKISSIYPCRDKFISQLHQYIPEENEQMCEVIYIYGHSGTGKTSLIKEFLSHKNCKYSLINVIECYTQDILFETILNDFNGHQLNSESNYNPYVKCPNVMLFCNEMKKLPRQEDYIIVLDNAEELRDLEYNVLPCFMKLQELTDLNICIILISTIPFEKYQSQLGNFDAQIIYLEQYTKEEMAKILTLDFNNIKKSIESKIMSKNTLNRSQLEILNSLENEFYVNYINMLLTIFFRVTRDIKELKKTARFCFEKYSSSVLDGTVDKTDVSKLWKNITQTFLILLRSIQIGIYQSDENLEQTQALNVSQLELPFFTKFLLIAAYLASNNNAKEDRKLFMKHHGKQRKKEHESKKSTKLITQLGPQSFTIDRLLAIFYAILEKKVDLNSKILAQISNLVHLRLLKFVSNEGSIMEGNVRLQCTVGMDFILHVGKTIGFNVRQYLCDFM